LANYKKIKVGSNNSNDITIDASSISRNHAEFFIDDEDNVFLTDLNSSFGTFVNDIRIKEPVLLNLKDKVTLGDHITINHEKLLNESYSINEIVNYINKRSWWIRNFDILIIYLINLIILCVFYLTT